MVNLGPQLVQLMNGYPNRRSAGSESSRRQSAQVAVSADTRVRRPLADQPGLVLPGRLWLAAMAKDADRFGAMARRGDPLDPGQRGRVPFQQEEEFADHRHWPFDLDEHPVEVVADEPGQAQPGGQGVHERAEADALDDPLHPDRRPDQPAHPKAPIGAAPPARSRA